MDLTFKALREANLRRIPQFKTPQGILCHSKPDGSDWTPAQWLQALVGELGEWASVRLAFDRGEMLNTEFFAANGKELADVQIYLDLLAARSTDRVEVNAPRPANSLLAFMAALGELCNLRKKMERGDMTFEEYARRSAKYIMRASDTFTLLIGAMAQHNFGGAAQQVVPGAGVDLGWATVHKFNEVSDRVGADVKL